jgi:hypothetical protein
LSNGFSGEQTSQELFTNISSDFYAEYFLFGPSVIFLQTLLGSERRFRFIRLLFHFGDAFGLIKYGKSLL